jgi:integrase
MPSEVQKRGVSMAKKELPKTKEKLPKVRGVFERPKDSDVWWIQYFKDGVRTRECIGRRGDAIDAVKDRKVAIRRGLKLPDLRNGAVTLSTLIDDALEYQKDRTGRLRDYECKAKIVKEAMGARRASAITPQEIDAWMNKRTKSPATYNRYRAFLSMVYRQAMLNRKQDSNPARLVRQKKEPPGRLRFLHDAEYDRLIGAIESRCPEHKAEFIVSVHAGMRLTEQYTTEWGQVSFDRATIELTKTKNGSRRTVHLNADAVEAVRSMQRPGQKRTDRVFPNPVADFSVDDWFHPCRDAAEITDYVWHSNRHTFCSWLAMNGASIREIQVAAGHKTIQMAAKYSHLSPTHNQGVVDRISSGVRKLVNAA